jgi:hypothetical protein
MAIYTIIQMCQMVQEHLQTAYSYAKNTAKLDFFSLADHSGSISSTDWTDIKKIKLMQ